MKGFFLKIKPFICIFQSFQKHRLILVVHFFCPFNPRTIMWPFRNVWRKCRVKMRVTVLHHDCEFLACFLAQGEQSDHGPKSVSRQLIGQACWLQALLSYCWHNWKQLLFQKYSSCRNCLSKKHEILLHAASAGIMCISLQQLKMGEERDSFLIYSVAQLLWL